MKTRDADRELTKREERALLKVAGEAIKSDFSNPQRLNCPQSATLQQIARRRLTSPDTEDLIDHIAMCAPCFAEYNRQRRLHLLRRRGGLGLACLCLLVTAGLAWHVGERPPTVAKKAPVSQTPAVAPVVAVLDLQSATTQRSAEPGREMSPPPHLIRGLLNLTIKLPIGTEDGAYDVQFRTLQGEPVVISTGQASWDGDVERLVTRVDLRGLPKGEHVLALRTGNFSWRTYRVFLD